MHILVGKWLYLRISEMFSFVNKFQQKFRNFLMSRSKNFQVFTEICNKIHFWQFYIFGCFKSFWAFFSFYTRRIMQHKPHPVRWDLGTFLPPLLKVGLHARGKHNLKSVQRLLLFTGLSQKRPLWSKAWCWSACRNFVSKNLFWGKMVWPFWGMGVNGLVI